jgi:hypothetical protein
VFPWVLRFHGDALACMDAHEYGLGASSDSFYEYMLKQWLLSGGKDRVGGWPCMPAMCMCS